MKAMGIVFHLGHTVIGIDARKVRLDDGVPVDEGKVVGIVSRGDFRGMELDRLDEETGLWERIG